MSRKTKLLYIIIIFLISSNITTVFYFNHRIESLRMNSSFEKVGVSSDTSFKKCLGREGIKYKVKNGSLMIREVDIDQAISGCS